MDPNDVKGDPLDGTETMRILGVRPIDLEDSQRFQKVQEIVDYFKGRPDKKTMLYRALVGKPSVDKINHIHEYVGIRREYEKTMNELSSFEEGFKKLSSSRAYLEKQLSYFER